MKRLMGIVLAVVAIVGFSTLAMANSARLNEFSKVFGQIGVQSRFDENHDYDVDGMDLAKLAVKFSRKQLVTVSEPYEQPHLWEVNVDKAQSVSIAISTGPEELWFKGLKAVHDLPISDLRLLFGDQSFDLDSVDIRLAPNTLFVMQLQFDVWEEFESRIILKRFIFEDKKGREFRDEATLVYDVASYALPEPTYGIYFEGASQPQTVLAGTSFLVGRVVLRAENGRGNLRDLAMKNTLSASNADLGPIMLFTDEAMTEKVGASTIDWNGQVTWENLSYEFSDVTYLWFVVSVRSIDYSASPGPFATATAGNQFRFEIVRSDIENPDTGNYYYDVHSDIQTPVFTIVGAMPGNIAATDAGERMLMRGPQVIFSYAVASSDSSNLDVDGDKLPLKLTNYTLRLKGANLSGGYNAVSVSDFYIFTPGSAKLPLLDGYGGPAHLVETPDGSVVRYDLSKTFGVLPGGVVNAGELKEYKIGCFVDNLTVGESLQGELIDMVGFVHNTGNLGIDGQDTRNFVYNVDTPVTGPKLIYP